MGACSTVASWWSPPADFQPRSTRRLRMFPGLLHGRGSSRASQFWMGLRSFLRTLVFAPLVSAVLCVGQQGKNLEFTLQPPPRSRNWSCKWGIPTSALRENGPTSIEAFLALARAPFVGSFLQNRPWQLAEA